MVSTRPVEAQMEALSGHQQQGEQIEIDDQNAGFPHDPEFYRRVLDFLPTPVVVLDGLGHIAYFNRALLALGDWDLAPGAGVDFRSFVHPDDREALTSAFAAVVQCPTARVLGGREWAEIFFRLTAADGSAIPVEIVGSGGLLDDSVGGVIYEVRPALRSDLQRRVLDGLSRGASMLQLLSLIGKMIASPPVDLDAMILQSTPTGELVLAASTSAELDAALRGSHPGLPWEPLTKEPKLIDLADLPPAMSERFAQSRYQELWYVSVESPLTSSTLRILTASPHAAGTYSPNTRLLRAQEIASAVLLRTQADVLLARAAHHDPLTDLPNRAAFHQAAESLDPMLERAALHLDLDGLKPVNDTYGSHCGDAVLQVVADRLRATCTSSDVIGRLGDDEFAILLTSNYDGERQPMMERALQLASRVLDAVNDPIVVGGRSLQISASIGVASAPPKVSSDHLLTWADAALHDAKSTGGGRICRFGVAFI